MITYSELWNIQEPLLAMAAVSEVLLRSNKRIVMWRNQTAEWWFKLQSIKWENRIEINKKFLEAFNLIYGKKPLSLRRFFVSCLLSSFFVIIFYFLTVNIAVIFYGSSIAVHEATGNPIYSWVNYKNTLIHFSHSVDLVVLLVGSIGINIIPDYISVLETEWILKKASDIKHYLFTLFVVDFMLTTLIWIIAHTIEAYISDTIFNIKPFPLYYRYLSFEYPNHFVYVLTTYSTSIIWFCFILTVLFIGQLKRLSKIAVRMIESRIMTELPIASIVGSLCLLSWPILFLLRQFFIH